MKAFLKVHKSSAFGSKLVFTERSGKIDQPDFEWEDGNEEFRFQQELYDVVSIEKKNGKIEIICLKDNNENQLESQLNQIHKLYNNNSSKQGHKRIKNFSTFYFHQAPGFTLIEIELLKFSHSYSAAFVTRFIETLQPPPDVNWNVNTLI